MAIRQRFKFTNCYIHVRSEVRQGSIGKNKISVFFSSVYLLEV